VAEAVAVRNGRVIQVGDDHSVRRLIGRRTEVVNLRGRTVLPGINDAHLHGLRTGLSLPPYNLDVGEPAVRSIADIAAAVGDAVAQMAPAAWIRGKGWDETKLAEGRAPHRGDLDGVAPDHPVALLDWSNHQLWVNSKALEITGITADTPAPEGGVIVKDAAVGRGRDLRRLVGRRTELLDAGGGTVLPGINDSHLHLNAFGLDFPPFTYNVDTATIAELVAVVQAAVAEVAAPDAWIRGQGWNDNRLPRPPLAADLDRSRATIR
jgi:predicted amidohydrolase YtcJ